MSEAIAIVEFGLACLVRNIRILGLQIAAQKTECVLFGRYQYSLYNPTHRLNVEESSISIGSTMKYLGLHIRHFRFSHETVHGRFVLTSAL